MVVKAGPSFKLSFSSSIISGTLYLVLVFTRQTLKSWARVKNQRQNEVQWPGNSEPAHFCTCDSFFVPQMTNWEKSKEQENTQHISHAVHLQNTVEILMLYFNVVKSLHTVSQHHWTLSVSHISAILQPGKAGMVNKAIWVDLLKYKIILKSSVFSEVPEDSEIYRETMLNLKAKNKSTPVGEFQGWAIPLGLLCQHRPLYRRGAWLEF